MCDLECIVTSKYALGVVNGSYFVSIESDDELHLLPKKLIFTNKWSLENKYTCSLIFEHRQRKPHLPGNVISHQSPKHV